MYRTQISGMLKGTDVPQNLKQAIRDLWPKRAEMKKCLEQMRAIAKWAKSIGSHIFPYVRSGTS